MGNPKIMSNVMEKIEVPIPPLAIQKEIVKILDAFTTLEAELEARKKQYEHYQDDLLTLFWSACQRNCLPGVNNMNTTGLSC